jgi:hypothetical protein
MTIPTTPQTETIHRLARELREADYELQLAFRRFRVLQAELETAKAQRRNEAEQMAAVEAVVLGLAGGWVE